MPASMPAKDLSSAPDEWLEVYFSLIDDDPAVDHEARFAREIQAIYRMHEIEVESDVTFACIFGTDIKALRAELVRRGLREPEPEPELITRTAAANAIASAWGKTPKQVKYFVTYWLPVVHAGGREWRRTADVRRFIETDGRAFAELRPRRTAG